MRVPKARVAAESSVGWILAKAALQSAAFWLVFLALLPALVWELETALGLAAWRFPSETGLFLGAALFLAGGVLGPWCSVLLATRGLGTPLPIDCPRRLVVAGPYRFVRNPMAVAGIAQGVAVGLMLGSPGVVIYALCGAPVWDAMARPWEEADLLNRFGAEYNAYRDAVRCWRPRLTPYRGM